MGPSGSGKSTFLHLAGALDLPSSGAVLIKDTDTSAMSDTERTLLRRRRLGFIFQFFNLIPTLTVHENVGLPLLLDGDKISSVREKVSGLLERVGLGARQVHLPEELSGGEMQRVAIARSLVHDPEILLADEPTGNLDSATGTEIMELLQGVASESNKTIVMVTHDARVAGYADRTLHLR
jgi:putative ABC transport system ATP-binding protein